MDNNVYTSYGNSLKYVYREVINLQEIYWGKQKTEITKSEILQNVINNIEKFLKKKKKKLPFNESTNIL